MVSNKLVDGVKNLLNKKTLFNCVKENDEVSRSLLKAGFTEYSPLNCIIYNLRYYYSDCILLSGLLSNGSLAKGDWLKICILLAILFLMKQVFNPHPRKMGFMFPLLSSICHFNISCSRTLGKVPYTYHLKYLQDCYCNRKSI